MKRIHLFEIEDFNWFPSFLRNYLTDFLSFLSNKANVYKSIVPDLLHLLDKSKDKVVVDLGAGAGGLWQKLGSELKQKNEQFRVVMTDFYPNILAFEKRKSELNFIDFHKYSVDATQVPDTLTGIRTLFLSFHHFKPSKAQSILQHAVDAKQPIAIFEIQDRSFPSLLAMLLSPLSVLFTTPFIQPFSVGRLCFTYIIPIVPFVVLWDGIVSSLRTYSVNELKEMTAKLKNTETFDWKIEKRKDRSGFVILCIGFPK